MHGLLINLIAVKFVTFTTQFQPISKKNMRFLGNVVATIVGLFLFCMISFFGFLFLMAIFGSGSETVAVKNNSVIELDLSKISTDYAGKFHYEEFDYFDARHDGLSDVINAIIAAKTDDDIKGISILNDNSNLGMAQIKMVRSALEDFKKSRKFVYAYGTFVFSMADDFHLDAVFFLEIFEEKHFRRQTFEFHFTYRI